MDSNSNTIRSGELGLLLSNGGTVCDDYFSDNSASAICKEMGFLRHRSWTSGSKWSIQSSLSIRMDDVQCSSPTWSSCTSKTSHNCGHSEDVFLQCEGELAVGEYNLLFLPVSLRLRGSFAFCLIHKVMINFRSNFGYFLFCKANSLILH